MRELGNMQVSQQPRDLNFVPNLDTGPEMRELLGYAWV